MKRRHTILGIVGIVALLIGVGYWLLSGQHFALLQPSGDVAAQQRNLIFLTVGLSLIVVIPVFTMLITFAWRYREDNKKANYQPNWSENNTLEVIWWGIPIAIIGCLAMITWFTSHSLDPYRPLESSKKATEVQVVALQWKWLFIYPEYGVATVNQLPMEVDRPVHFTLTANAPMSAFWIPSLGTQIYTMNGMKSQLNLVANKVGEYDGYNTNINGAGYSKMKFTAKALSEKDFQAWVKNAKQSSKTLTMESYRTLSTPGTANAETYILSDTTLYDTIVHEGMMGTGGQTEQPMKHDMEGMHHE